MHVPYIQVELSVSRNISGNFALYSPRYFGSLLYLSQDTRCCGYSLELWRSYYEEIAGPSGGILGGFAARLILVAIKKK